jgi:hypothetical protein
MAYKISGTTVIDTLGLNNITDTVDVKYDRCYAKDATSTSGSTISFYYNIYYLRMNGDKTFTEVSKEAGRSLLFILDRSTYTTPDPTQIYTPTFSSNIKWAGGVEPTWSNYRYWVISMVCVDSTIVRATAEGYLN